MTPLRLTAVLTHPIQYYAPWFRYIHRECGELALTVVYATSPTPEQQGVGFDRAFEWDIPLTEGYESVTVRPGRSGESVHSGNFTGLDVPEIGDAIARTTPDVVLITGWYSVTLVRALAACRRLGVPTLYRGDSHLNSGPANWRRLLWSLKTRLFLRQFDGFLSPGTRVTEYLRHFGAPTHRIFTVPHGVDNDLFASSAAPFQAPTARASARAAWKIDEDAFVPLFAGKFVDFKRPLDVIEASAPLGRGVTPLFVGSGPLGKPLAAEAMRLDVDVRDVGFLNQTEIGRAYAVADCLVLPSDSRETWGLVVNEALATGLPCIVSDAVGCAPDLVVEGETGYAFALGDIAALTNRLETLRVRKSEGFDWTVRCRELVERFSFSVMTAGLVKASRSVIRRSTTATADWRRSPVRIVACCGQMVSISGVERMTFMVLGTLRAHGATIHCIVNGWENFRITPLAEQAGASWSVGPYWHTLTRRRLTPSKIVKMIWEEVRVSADLLGEVRRVDATHVFVPDFLTALRNGLALLWLRARGVKVVAKIGNAPELGAFYRWLWRWVVNPLVDVFICNSEFTRQEVLAHGVAARKTVVIPNASPPRPMPWPGDTDRVHGRVVYVGQIIPPKGLHLLLDAIAMARARGIDATLDVVGVDHGWEAQAYAGYYARVHERAAAPDVRGAVRFLGYREDVPVIMGQAEVHCCPSLPEIREAFGLVVLEAKLSGLPSVVTDSGNLATLVSHGVDGWVCRAPAAEAIADGLAYFLTDDSTLARARAAARASAAKFNEHDITRAWTRVFFPPEEAKCA